MNERYSVILGIKCIEMVNIIIRNILKKIKEIIKKTRVRKRNKKNISNSEM